MSDMMDEAFDFIKYIKSKNYRAYIVGGAVRDSMFCNNIHDIDIVTNAPVDVFRVFVTADLSKHKNGFETYQIFYNGYVFEISTMRGDNIYDDLRHRDITINALAYDEDRNLIYNDDFPTTIKMCYDKAFREDPIRILRAIRFYAEEKYGDIEEETFHAMKVNMSFLKDEKYAERIVSELSRSFSEGHVNYEKYIHMLFKTGFMKTMFPNVYTDHLYKNVGKFLILLSPKHRMTGFFCCLNHDSDFSEKLRSMKFSNDVVNMVKMFDINLIEKLVHYKDSELYDFMQKEMNMNFLHIVENLVLILRHDKDAVMKNLSIRIDSVNKKSEMYPRYAIDGNELMKITGLESGPEFGKLYREINDTLFNTGFPRDVAIHHLKKRYHCYD